MSSESKRSISEISSAYQSLCVKAGHIQYQVFTLTNDLKLLNQELRDLNLEAAAAQKAEAEAKQEASKPTLVPVASE